MKKLSELYDIDSDVLVKDIKLNSKQIEKGDLFVCVSGVTADRHEFIDEAIEKGAVAIVVSKNVNETRVPVIKVEDTNKELPLLEARFYDYPDKELTIIGVTGTNGKTTVAKVIKDLIGDRAAYIGSLGAIWKDNIESLRNTTPDTDVLYKYFRKFVDSGCNILVMEAASEAFYRHRLDNIDFFISVLTNITEDHLNIHKTLDNYISCKKELFLKTKNTSILNSDDKYFDILKEGITSKILTYGKRGKDLKILSIEEKEKETLFEIELNKEKEKFTIPLVGEFNVYNFSSCILVMLELGYSIKEIKERINNIKTVGGRCEFINYGQDYKIVLDYAHTPDALEKILTYLNKIKKKRIITLTGSAGGREKEKRSLMGKIVLDMSDYVIFTMDDPRYEDVNDIIDDLISDSNKTNYERVVDRKEAIYKAFDMAEKDDIILIAGKGRDNYMAIKDKYLPYNDYDVIRDYFR